MVVSVVHLLDHIFAASVVVPVAVFFMLLWCLLPLFAFTVVVFTAAPHGG